MNRLSNPRLILTSISVRLHRVRPGSLLFIAVVLLIFLGIIGVAFISSSRSVRVASAQNVMNSDVDLMLSGISKACEGLIIDDLNDSCGNLQGLNAGATQYVHSAYRGQYVANQTYRQGDVVSLSPPTPPYFFVALKDTSGAPTINDPKENWAQTTHIPGVTSSAIQPWLADRIPTPEGIVGKPDVLAYWPNISQMAVPGTSTLATSILGTPFESPDGTAMPLLGPGATLCGQIGVSLVPGFRQLSGGVSVPTLTYIGLSTPMIAADADGDGIADSLFFRIPGAANGGLTWYAAVRIIDNNSAINLNTALSRDKEYTITGGSLAQGGLSNYYCLFPTSVGLAELLHPHDKPANFANFNAYRVGASAEKTPQADVAPGATNPLMPVTRPDFQFLDGADLLNDQLIRRIANPGFSGNGTRCAALPLSDEAALAYRFCLVNPQTVTTRLTSSLSETLLPFSLLYWQPPDSCPPQYYRSTPYGNSGAPCDADVNQWFNDNFNYQVDFGDYGGEPQPLRSLLVSRNPVSNAITPVYDADAGNTGEPIDPLGTSPVANTVQGMMLPYGTGPQNSSHFKGPWQKSQMDSTTNGYKFNDIVVGGDGHTYIFVNPPGASLPNDPKSAVMKQAPTLQNLPSSATDDLGGGQDLYKFWHFQPWMKSPVKANANTATFRELYRAFWSVMAGNPSNQTPFGNTNPDYNPYDYASNPQHQFRSPLRDPTYTDSGGANVTRLDPENTMLLRAAIAAVNTLGLRDATQNVVSRTVYLNALMKGESTPVMARVYSCAPQPVISEIYANTYRGFDSGTPSIFNDQGYVAVELYNPYSVPMVLKNWQLGLVNRSAAGRYPNLEFLAGNSSLATSSVMAQFAAQNDPRINPATSKYDAQSPPAGTIILPAHGYALLENYNPAPRAMVGTGDAMGRPASAGFVLNNGTPKQTGIWLGPDESKPNTCDVYVPGLQLVIAGAAGSTMTTPRDGSPGGELVLLRPRRCDGILTSSDDPLNTFDEGTPAEPNLYDLVPVDSYDFTGLAIGDRTQGEAWSYIRTKGEKPITWFKQFYPGRYFSQPAPAPREENTDEEKVIGGAATEALAWKTNAAPKFGQDVLPSDSLYTNNFPPIQIYNTYNTARGTDSIPGHWPNPMSYLFVPPTTIMDVTLSDSPYVPQYPYGTFARNGDLLDIPFVGAYRITPASIGNPKAGDASWSFVELNSLPRDCSFADATYTDPLIQNVENIGRFCPLAARGHSPLVKGNGQSDPDYYAWASNLFSYLTVQSPADAALPSVDPNINDVTYLHVPSDPASPPYLPVYKYPPPWDDPTVPPPSMVLTADPTAPDQTDQGDVGVEGLININTASWKVLSMLPMITASEDPINWNADNEGLAKAIVAYRKTRPFLSIFDLNSVPGFQDAAGHLAIANGGNGVTTANGLLNPPDPMFPGAVSKPPFVCSELGEDYQSDFAMLTRISNLISTRSDTFTVYIEVQGWQNAGTAQARPVITRRYSYIVDRSAINGNPSSRFLKTITVPTD